MGMAFVVSLVRSEPEVDSAVVGQQVRVGINECLCRCPVLAIEIVDVLVERVGLAIAQFLLDIAMCSHF